MTKIKKVGMFSFAKLYAVMLALSGFFVGLVFAFSSLYSKNMTGESIGRFGGLGLLAILVIPLIYALLGFVVGAFGAVVFNVVSRIIGGLEVELEQA